MERDCGECENLKSRRTHETNHIIIHTSSQLICGPNKDVKKQNEWKKTGRQQLKKDRDEFVWDLKRGISALRNSGGGIAFVHISNLHPEDRCLDPFNELVDERLNDMIEDGSPFVTTYKKDWLSEDQWDKDFVAIVVSPSASVVTADYKTKIPLDNSIKDPSGPTISKYLRQNFKLENTKARIRGLDFVKLRESRCVQVKALIDNSGKLNNVETLVDYIWEDLRLREYITAFSKLDGGGSIFVGIQEENKNYETYCSKHMLVIGFEFILSKTTFISELKEKVKAKTSVLVRTVEGIKFVPSENLIEAVFHTLPNQENVYVLEVAVAAVEGLVFYDEQGPEAYEFDDDNEIQRLNLNDWYRRLFKKPSRGTQTS